MKPELVIYSCSLTNGYGYPNIRLAQTFAPPTEQNRPYRIEAMYSTANNGTIVVRSNGITCTAAMERD